MNFLQFIQNIFRKSAIATDEVEINEEVKQQNFRIKFNDLGVFGYNSSGFNIDLKNEFHVIKWQDIERLEAYKADLLTVDEICIDITYNNKTVIITEETKGWYKFLEALKKSLPIESEWEELVIKSPFEYDLTTIYERGDRKMPQSPNFFSTLKGITVDEISYIFQKHGWTILKSSLKDYKFTNSWTDLILERKDEELLLHGFLAYHPDNTSFITQTFRELKCPFKIEFYDENKKILEETIHNM